MALSLAVLLLISLSGCKEKKESSTEEAQETATTEQETTTKALDLPPFEYEPTAPTDGKLKGVVELGASGFNLFVIELDQEKNWVIKKKEFGNSLVTENMTSAEEVKSTLKDYIKTILDFGVQGKNIHFVVSSGAAKEEITQSISGALKELGYVVNVVTPEQEAKYALRSVLPKEYESSAFVVDLGSGNTKVSYIKNGKETTLETYGAKYYQKEIAAEVVYNDVVEKMKSIPPENTNTCFLIGGVPYQLAREVKKGDERYTVIPTDLIVFNSLAETEGVKMVCGLNIYKGILDATNCQQVVFDWDANFTIGFLLSLPY